MSTNTNKVRKHAIGAAHGNGPPAVCAGVCSDGSEGFAFHHRPCGNLATARRATTARAQGRPLSGPLRTAAVPLAPCYLSPASSNPGTAAAPPPDCPPTARKKIFVKTFNLMADGDGTQCGKKARLKPRCTVKGEAAVEREDSATAAHRFVPGWTRSLQVIYESQKRTRLRERQQEAERRLRDGPGDDELSISSDDDGR